MLAFLCYCLVECNFHCGDQLFVEGLITPGTYYDFVRTESIDGDGTRGSSIMIRSLFWFGGENREGKDKGGDGTYDNQKHDFVSMAMDNDNNMQTGTMGATASMIENFKQSQDLGKRTAALVQDLSTSTIEGSAADGKVRVFVDGQQRPVGVDIDAKYIRNIASVEDLNEAITLAMQDANSKSLQQMQDKMSSLYADLGISVSKSV